MAADWAAPADRTSLHTAAGAAVAADGDAAAAAAVVADGVGAGAGDDDDVAVVAGQYRCSHMLPPQTDHYQQ